MTGLAILAAVYAIGVLVGLARTDGGILARAGLALAWPVGPAAFLLTVASLVLAGMVAFPVFGVAVATVAGAAWWWLSA